MKMNKPFIIFCFLILFFSFRSSSAQTESDAIAVRIIPNPNHFSVYYWYEKQGFNGAPQTLSVDGYEAIRDGRTVYVNAANVKGKEIFTNIYLISYNQNPSAKTVDILGQIIKNWKFNTDLNESVNPAPSCVLSAFVCGKDSDCSSGQVCLSVDSSHDSSPTNKTCQLKEKRNCLTDTDCPENFFCNSVKAKIIRDIKRIGQATEINEALATYKSDNGYYPKLESGTYIPGQTISVWPSWNDVFLPALSLRRIVDPVNHLGDCPNFDPITCWNNNTKKFYNNSNGNLILPPKSFAIAYKTLNKGADYSLCSVFESSEPSTYLNFKFSPETFKVSSCISETGIGSGGSVANTNPRLLNSYLIGEAEQEFSGSVVAVDDQNDALTWGIASNIDWVKAGWASGPALKSSSNVNQKKIYSAKAGKPGTYPITITINDNHGGMVSINKDITIVSQNSFIEAENLEYTLDPTTPLIYTLYVNNPNLSNYLNDITVSKVSGSNNFSLLSLTKSISQIALGRYKISYSGIIPTGNFLSSSDYVYRVSVKDKFGKEAYKDFKIIIKNTNPFLNFDCANSVRVGGPYSCLLGQTDQFNQKISYTYYSLPSSFSGLKINSSGKDVFLETQLAAISGSYSTSTIRVRASNQYGGWAEKEFKLAVNTYCGDGIKQNPNSEGRGGVYNDGQEDCDGFQGVALTAKESSSTSQYACATIDSRTPNPITNNNYCVFKSPIDGGGFCGDTYCQIAKENSSNCPQDCVSACSPQCTGKACGESNGCGGICKTGTCSKSGQTCQAGVCIYQCAPSCEGKTCGADDGCGGVCQTGTCSKKNEVCRAGACVFECAPDCRDKTCGADDGCGGICPAGDCPNSNQTCQDGVCVSSCSAQCIGNVCGALDGCGGICRFGTCPNSNQTCQAGVCVSSCVPSCEGKACGADDGCRGFCQTGTCSKKNEVCRAGACVFECAPDCTGKACGADDGCGGICQTGTCSNSSQICKAGLCTYQCVPNCTACGASDGCGGRCKLGTCQLFYSCVEGACELDW